MGDCERLRAELRARDEFLAKLTRTLSHSARAVQQAVRSQPSAAPEAGAAVARLQALLKELRVVADPAAPVPLRLRTLELGSTLECFFTERAKAFARERLRLALRREGSVVCKLDEAHLASMLDELLSNALKYRRGRAVSVELKSAPGSIAICVTNHGGWIGPKPTFVRFQRGERRRKRAGFGIGLWLTRRLAAAHGGGLTIETTRVRTRAIISLPCNANVRGHSIFCATLVTK